MPPWKRRRSGTVSRKCAVDVARDDPIPDPKHKRFEFHRPYRFENSARNTVFFRFQKHELGLQKQQDNTVKATASLILEVDKNAAQKFRSDRDINVIYTIKYEDGQGEPTILDNLMKFQFSPTQHGRVTGPSTDLGTIKFDQIHSVCWAISHYSVRKA